MRLGLDVVDIFESDMVDAEHSNVDRPEQVVLWRRFKGSHRAGSRIECRGALGERHHEVAALDDVPALAEITGAEPLIRVVRRAPSEHDVIGRRFDRLITGEPNTHDALDAVVLHGEHVRRTSHVVHR